MTIKKCMMFISGLVMLIAVGTVDAVDLSNVHDLKPLIMRTHGLRKAWAENDTTVKVVIGMSTTIARNNINAWRVISFDDTAYAYEKFVKPVSVKSPPQESVEFAFPVGYLTVKQAEVPITRSEVTIKLPTPMKRGAKYTFLAQGQDMGHVTAGLCSADFVYGAKTEPNEWDDDHAMAAQMIGLRRISSVGDGKLLCEFGPGYFPEAGLKLVNWQVTVNGQPRKVLAIGRRSKIECYYTIGWPYRGIMGHDVYLDIGEALKCNDHVVVKVSPEVTAGLGESSMNFDERFSLSRSIKTNQLGYLPDGIKCAYLGCWMGSMPEKNAITVEDEGKANKPAKTVFSLETYYAEAGKGTQEERELAELAAASAKKPEKNLTGYDLLAPYALRFHEAPKFQIVRVDDGQVAWEGLAKFTHNGLENDGKNNYSAENVYELDFTDFRKPGKYYLKIDGVGRSFDFAIAADVYAEAFHVQAQGIYCQRCGCELNPDLSGGWKRIACHDHGIITTTEQRANNSEWGKFADNMETDPNPAYPKVEAAREKVLHDPSRKTLSFNTIGATTVIKDEEFGEIYKTGNEEKGGNGVEANFKLDPAKGATFSFWVKRDDGFAGGKWDGNIVRLGEPDRGVELHVSWGCPNFYGNGFSRINDKKWWHMVLRVNPADKDGKARVQMIINGEDICEKPVDRNVVGLASTIGVGYVSSEGAEGCYFRDLMVFDRALSNDELNSLVSKVPARLPHTLMITGGHHDAGDYNPRSHIDVAQALMDMYELKPENFTDSQLNVPERGNGIPDVLDEALWALKLWEGLQDNDGGVRNGTESAGDPNMTQTVELDDKGDYAWAKDSKGSFLAAGTFAQASRLLKSVGKKSDAKRLLDRAKRAYEWAIKHPFTNTKSLGTYGEYNFALRAYAAAQLYHTTWEKTYHNDFREYSPWAKVPTSELESYGYFNATLAAYAYALIPREKADPQLWDAVLGAIRKHADMFIRGSEQMAYKFLKHPYAPVTWGTGAYENYAIVPAFAWMLTGETKYRDWLIRTCDNTLGTNPLGLSWITGLGERTIHCPLHNSRYRPGGFPVAGLQAQGPNKNGAVYSWKETVYPAHQDNFAVLHAFSDLHFAIVMDEPTVNNMANTLFVFGLLLK